MPSRTPARASRGGRPQGGYMPVLSPRRIAALALELGEDFEPGVTPPSATLLDTVALMQGAHPVECEPSAHERKRRRERQRRAAYARPQGRAGPPAPRGVPRRARLVLGRRPGADGLRARPPADVARRAEGD